MKRITLYSVFLFFMTLLSSNLEAQCVVTNTNDAGTGSLRQAIGDASCANITFATTVTGTIVLNSELDINRNNVVIDGSAAPNVVINGSAVNNPLVIDNQSNVTVRSLSIEGARNNGVSVNRSTTITLDNLSITGIGTSQNKSATDWVGTTKGEPGINNAGINMERSNELLIENCVVFNNDGHGIRLSQTTNDLNGDSFSAIVRNNKVGVLSDGNTPAGNLGDGILFSRSDNVLIDGNQSCSNGNRSLWPATPSPTAAEGMRTDNHFGAGIEVNGDNCTVINNFVGTNSTGSSTLSTALGNQKHGIYVRGGLNNKIGMLNNGNIVGGNGFAFGDVVTSNSVFGPGGILLYGVGHGIQLHDNLSPVRQTTVQSNFVGYFNGNCIENSQDGISMLGFGSGLNNNLIGGSNPGEGNIIGGSKFGIFSQGPSATGNIFQGNFIGTNGSNLADIGCPVGEDGIVFQNQSNNNIVGGTTPEQGNYIAYSPNNAIVVKRDGDGPALNNNIVGNIMSCNGGGIDIRDGGNNNFGADPRFAVNIATLTDDFIEGFSPNVGDQVDIYVADNCATSTPPCQAVGGNADRAQGFTYVGTINSVPNTLYDGIVDASGSAVAPEDGYFSFDFNSTLATSNGLTRDNIVFAGRDAQNNTSEFHKCVIAVRCDEPDVVEVTSDKDFFLCPGEEANVTSRVQLKAGDPSDPATDFNYTLYRVTGTGRNVYSTNNNGNFTVTDAGVFVLEATNVINSSVCSGFSEDTVRVSFQPSITQATIAPVNGPFCENDENAQFTVTGTSSSTFAWTRSDDASYNGTGNTVTLPTVTSDFTLTVVETTAAPFSCPQSPVNLAVEVNPLPTQITIGTKDMVCEDEVVDYSVTKTTGSSYAWSVTSPDASIVENDNVVTVTWGATSGSVQVIETNDNGCSTAIPSTLDVLVEPRPGVRNIFGPDSVCVGDIGVKYEVTSNGSNYEWTFDGVLQGSNSREVLVTIPDKPFVDISVVEITRPRQCRSTTPSTKRIVINTRPVPTNLVVSPSTDICIGDEFNVSVDAQAGVEFLWSSTPASIVGTPSTQNQLTLTGTESGTIIVNARNTTTSCESNFSEQLTVDITVHEIPAEPSISGPSSVTCSQDNVGFSVATPVPTSSYVWFYGESTTGVPAEGDTVLNGSSTVVNFGPRRAEVEVSEISVFGCASPLGSVIPDMTGCDLTANFSSNTRSECEGALITVTEQATYADVNLEPLVMKFIFPLADIDTIFVPQDSLPNATVNPTYTINGPGLYDVTMIVQQSGKADTFTIEDYIEVKPLPTINSEIINGSDAVCQNFRETYSISGTTGSTYTWRIGQNGTLLTSGTGLTNDYRLGPGTETTTITVTENRNGCIDSLKKDVNILPSPSTIDIADQDICQDDPITITLNGADPASTFVWEPSANVTATTPTSATFVFTTPGDARISVLETNTSGCVSVDSTSFATISVKPELATPVINGAGLGGICEGTTAQFSTAINQNFTYNWSTSDGNIDDVNASTINISEASAGTQTVSLFVFDGVCTSGTTDSTYIVEDLPDAPQIAVPSGTLCEGSEVVLSVNSPVATSTYEWSNLPDGTVLASGQQLIGVGNSTIRVILGPNDGTINVEEQTAIGCPSNVGTANLTVQNLLGDLDIIEETTGGICNAESIDSLATFNITWENATDITYTTDPSIVGLSQTGIGNQRQLNFVVPTGLLENQVIRVTATADADGCDIDTKTWSLNVKPSIIIKVEFDKREVCADESSMFTAMLDSSIVVGGTVGEGQFFWFYNEILLDSGVTFNTPSDVITGDEVKLVYEPNPNDCPVLSGSVFEDSVSLKAWQKPEVEGLVFDRKEYEVSDFVNPIELNAQLLINPELVVYNYEFFWKVSDDSTTNLGIASPSGRIVGIEGTSQASMQDARSTNTKQRQYFVETSIQTEDGRKICPVLDSMLVKVNLLIDPPPFLCHEPQSSVECPTWEVENSDAFENNVTIFNRWGSVVFESSNGLIQWDGTGKNGRPLPTGTYFYVIELSSELGERQYTGPVSIIK